jgi:hypothetical protein
MSIANDGDGEDKLRKAEARYESLAMWGGAVVVFGLVIEVALTAAFPKGLSIIEEWGPVFADVLIALGVASEVLFAARARSKTEALKRLSDEKVRLSDEKIAEAKVRAAEAGERAYEAQKETERLRSQNLTVQKLLTPRRLIMFSKDGDGNERAELVRAVAAFPGTPALVQHVPDFEAEKLAHDIIHMLKRCGWEPTLVKEPIISPGLISEGVRIFTNEVWPDPGTNPTSPTWLASSALVNLLMLDLEEKHSLFAVMHEPQFPAFIPSRFALPDGVVVILVGTKPIWGALGDMRWNSASSHPGGAVAARAAPPETFGVGAIGGWRSTPLPFAAAGVSQRATSVLTAGGQARTASRASRSADSSSLFIGRLPSRRENEARGHPDRRLATEQVDQHHFAVASRHARVQSGEASKRPFGDRHWSARLKGAANDGLRRQAGGQADDAVRIGPGDQRGDLFVWAPRRNAGGFDHAQDADRALEDAPLVDNAGEEVATEQRGCSPPLADSGSDFGREDLEAGAADALISQGIVAWR